MDFSTFKNKYILAGKIVVLNALHIGSGKETDDRDAPFISLDDDKNFYIPGSTFRGYLSTKLERFLDSGNGFKIKNNGEELNEADVKLIFGYTNLDKLETKINDKDNEEDRKLKENNRKIQDRIIRKLNAKNLDEVKSLAGRIHVSDMPVLKDVKYVTRDGIKIDRNTGATEKGAKFDYDVVPAGTEFDLNIELENIENYQLDLIGLALNDILKDNGDLFGGKTSRGIGKCRLKDLKMKYVTSDDKEKLKKYIFEGKFPYEVKKQEKIFKTENLSLD
ncbi:RAMP superfamily CRISPR-associated protein [Leptotrichia trevisanii]|uniref:RAMP superfamily CRISPR-associated protein n=1 Tax=Leptotrichia trevisanii TaxID=109328 RepID=UPI0026F355F2|nr:RAMP superfamily CRISPR-associated protein [Leptotrichia trevisanii]